MRWTYRLPAVIFLAAGVAAAGWWWSRPVPPAVRPLAVVISGDTAGWIVPCGCTSNQSGGLPRRGTFVRDLGDRAEVLYADAGGSAGGDSPYDRFKFEAILRGELLMGLVAHNVGAQEAALGVDSLGRLTGELGVPFVSANVHPTWRALRSHPTCGSSTAAAGGSPLPASYPPDTPARASKWTIRGTVSSGSRLNLPGSTTPCSSWPTCPKTNFAASRRRCPRCRRWLVDRPARASLRVPPDRLLSPRQQTRGKFLVKFDAPTVGKKGWTGEVVELTGQWADDADQVANVREYLNSRWVNATSSRRNPGLAPTIPPGAPAGYRRAGSAACKSCHPSDSINWDGSKHAHAWDSLTRHGNQVDPFCQQCHTTGFGLPGGFVSAIQVGPLGTVGCEELRTARRKPTLTIRSNEPRSQLGTSASPATTARTAQPFPTKSSGRKCDTEPRP